MKSLRYSILALGLFGFVPYASAELKSELNPQGGVVNGTYLNLSTLARSMVAPMSFNGSAVSTSVTGKGEAIYMVYANKGTYALDFLSDSPSEVSNSMSVALYPYNTTATGFKNVVFNVGSGLGFQRTRARFDTPSAGWYFLHLRGVEAGTPISGFRLVLDNSGAINGNQSFVQQTGSFTLNFAVKPANEHLNAIVGVSSGAISSLNQLAAGLSINQEGVYAFNGTARASLSQVPYFQNSTYLVRMEIDYKTQRYSAFVSVKGVEYTVAKDFKLRLPVESIDNLAHALGSNLPIVVSGLTAKGAAAVVTAPNPPVPAPGNVGGNPVADVPPLSANARVLKVNETVTVGGMPWGVQTNGIILDNDMLRFKASTGDFASFDPADGRKIRNEVAGMTKMEAFKLFTAEMDLVVNGPSVPHEDLQWWGPVQIHQADTRDAKGVPIMGSPLFGLDLQPNKAKDGYDLLVRAETSTNMNGGFVPVRILAKVPFALGAKHRVKFEIIDSHGKAGGLVRVWLNGKSIVDMPNTPTGWSYVDSDVLLGGKKQDNRSYLKLGIYAGNQFRPAPVTLETYISNFSFSIR